MKQITQNLRWLITLLAMIVSVGAWADDFELYSGEITEGDYIICYNSSNTNYALNASTSGNYIAGVSVQFTNGNIVNPIASIIWHIASSGNYWTIYNTSDANAIKYVASTGKRNYAQLLNSGTDDKSLWTISKNDDSSYKFLNKVKDTNYNLYLAINGSNFYCYSNENSNFCKLRLYKKVLTTPITKIYNLQDLKDFRETVNNGVDYSTVSPVTLMDNITVPEWNTPIGVYASKQSTVPGTNIKCYIEDEANSKPFNGIFEGGNHTITLGSSSVNGQNGLFGFLKGATVQNLTVNATINNTSYVENWNDDDVIVSTSSTEDFSFGFGGIANIANSSTFTKCNVQGTIKYQNQNNVGGVVGRVQGSGATTITTCDVSASFNGHRMTGGVVGGIYDDGVVTITDCSASAQVYGNSCTGGIVGNSENTAGITIEKCFNKAPVGNNNSIKGGIIGHMKKGTITSCYNANTVSGSGSLYYVGGIAGYVEEGTISYCYNSVNASVTGRNNSGGIVGKATKTTIQNVYNVGSIEGDVQIDAIASSFDDNSSCENVFYLSGSSSIPGCTALASSDMQGWKLYSGDESNTNKIGYGNYADTETQNRKWVFVSQNYPLLYEVRGQVVNFQGHQCKHFGATTTADNYLSFSSDVIFTTTGQSTKAYWIQKNKHGGVFFETTVEENEQPVNYAFIASHSTSVLYPFDDNNTHQLGYILEDADKPTLQYRTKQEKSSLSNLYNTYNEVYITSTGAIGHRTNQEMTETTIRQNNALYGIDESKTKGKLIEDNSGCSIYVFGYRDRTGDEEFDTAIFGKYGGTKLGANKSYIAVDNSQVEKLEVTGVKAFSIYSPIVEPEAVLLGDVDVDGAVTVTDVVKMVNVVLNESADDVIMKHGDVNGDGDLDVADVVAIVNKVLGVENDVKSRKVNSVANGGDEASLELNDGVVDFLLSNSSAFCAFQFYMSAEDGLDCEKIILSARAKGHTVSMNKLSDGRYKVMCYSGVNKSFEGSEGELFNIQTSGASGKLTLEDLFFVTPGASKVKFGNMDIDVVPTGINGIDADENANTIFDLSGRRVQKAQKGVYIVNGKKVIL